MEGVCRDNVDRREDAKQFIGEDGDESARALTRVAHYRPWVRRERNILAEKAGQPQPYPVDGKVRPADNGERFYYEYHLAQQKRDLEHGGMQTPAEIIKAGGCTCKECTDIRQAKVQLLPPAPAPAPILHLPVSSALSSLQPPLWLPLWLPPQPPLHLTL